MIDIYGMIVSFIAIFLILPFLFWKIYYIDNYRPGGL
jgi:hypothetical protein